MTKQEARAIIQKHYEDLTKVFRSAHPLPDLRKVSESDLNAYLDEQDAFVNAEIFRLVPAEVRQLAV